MNRKELKQYLWNQNHLKLNELQRAVFVRFKKRVPLITLLEIKLENYEVKLKMVEDRLRNDINNKIKSNSYECIK